MPLFRFSPASRQGSHHHAGAQASRSRPSSLPEQPMPESAPTDGGTTQTAGTTGATNAGRSSSQSRVRLLPSSSSKWSSREFFLHASTVWISHCVFCILLLLKLNGSHSSMSWWSVFAPLFVGYALHAACLVWSLCTEKERVTEQLGPPPPTSASLALHAQYTSLRAMAGRAHLVDNTNMLLDTLAMLIVQIQFAQLLNSGQFKDVSLRVVFAPIWAVWVVTLVLVCTKYKRDRVFGSGRDLVYIFLLMVSFKVDGETSISWRVVFLLPWLWLSGVLVLALVVTISLSCARLRGGGWRRFKELQLPVGFLLLLLSTGAPNFAFCVHLVSYLEGSTNITLASILIPAAVAWGSMWLSSIVLCMGLYARERLRATLLASGAVWQAQEQLLRRLHPGLEREQEQLRVDAMSEEELVTLARRYMSEKGVTTPTSLIRVGPSLYRLPDASTNGAAANQNGAAGVEKQDITAAVEAAEIAITVPAAESVLPSKQSSQVQHITIEMQEVGPAVQQTDVQTGSQPLSDVECGEHQGNTPGEHHQGRLSLLRISRPGARRVEGGSRPGTPTHASTSVQPGMGSITAGQNQGEAGLLPRLFGNQEGLAALFGLDQGSLQEGAAGVHGEESDDGQCVICFDAAASCVLLPCGHGGLCRRCAHLLCCRPPNACATCRQAIEQVVELESSVGIGKPAAVKQHTSEGP